MAMKTFGAEFIETSEAPAFGSRAYIQIGGAWYLVTSVDQWGRPTSWEPI